MGWLRSVRTRWSRFRRLSRSERGLLAETLVLLPLAVVAQRALGFARCRGILERLANALGTRPRMTDDPAAEVRVAARLFDRAARRCPCPTSCMHRSLVLWWLLRRRGFASRLLIGVHKEAGCFEAHAWVECLGSVLNDPDDLHRQFAPFADPILV